MPWCTAVSVSVVCEGIGIRVQAVSARRNSHSESATRGTCVWGAGLPPSLPACHVGSLRASGGSEGGPYRVTTRFFDIPMRQLAAESSFKLVIRRVVPCFERCNPSINKRSLLTSPFLHRKLSWLHIKTHPFSSAIRLISSFIETPFTAAASLSVRGVMLLRLTWPVAETRFASSATARRFEEILLRNRSYRHGRRCQQMSLTSSCVEPARCPQS